MTIIKAGYRLTVTSWENDADNYRTTVNEGYDRPTLEFIVDFIKLFYSQNNRTHKGFGNMYEPEQHETQGMYEAFDKIVEKHQGLILVQENVQQYFVQDDGSLYKDQHDGIFEFAYEFFGSSEYYTTRVLDSFKVEHVPHDIELIDVTESFK